MRQTKEKLRGAASGDIKARHMLRQRKRRRKKILIRTVLVLVLLASALSAIVFLTPWFNITAVEVHGNQKVSAEQIVSASGVATGSNTFAFSLGRATDRVLGLPYIKTVNFRRIFLPVKVIAEVTETRLVCYAAYAGGFVGIDNDGKAAEIMTSAPGGVPAVKGMNLVAYELGRKAEAEMPGQIDAILMYTGQLESAGLLSDTTDLDVTSLMDVKFIYQGRLKAYCADGTDLERKLLMFKEVEQNQLPAGARGEIDLTVKGMASYRP